MSPSPLTTNLTPHPSTKQPPPGLFQSTQGFTKLDLRRQGLDALDLRSVTKAVNNIVGNSGDNERLSASHVASLLRQVEFLDVSFNGDTCLSTPNDRTDPSNAIFPSLCVEKLKIFFAAGLDKAFINCNSKESTNSEEQVSEYPYEALLPLTLENLFMVGFRHCKLQRIPEPSFPPNGICQISWLILTNNELTSLPESFGNLRGLRKCGLSNNRLTRKGLPDSIGGMGKDSNCEGCINLELLRLSDNCLESVPDWLIDGKSLKKLAWLSLSGNKIEWVRNNGSSSSGTSSTTTTSTMFNVSDLGLKINPETKEFEAAGTADSSNSKTSILGQGTSGTVFRTQTKGSSNDVAVKMFKPGVTSDGDSEHELFIMNLLAEAQSQSNSESSEKNSCSESQTTWNNLARVYGMVKNEEDVNKPLGCVMSLLTNYKASGNPPNFHTCTRDTFDNLESSEDVSLKKSGAGSSFFNCYSSYKEILEIARDITRASWALIKKCGVFHGDVYLHNSVTRSLSDNASKNSTHSVLVDFGASFAIDRSKLNNDGSASNIETWCEKLEVLAIGNLIDDLMQNVGSASSQQGGPEMALLEKARTRCFQDPIERPTITELMEILSS